MSSLEMQPIDRVSWSVRTRLLLLALVVVACLVSGALYLASRSSPPATPADPVATSTDIQHIDAVRAPAGLTPVIVAWSCDSSVPGTRCFTTHLNAKTVALDVARVLGIPSSVIKHRGRADSLYGCGTIGTTPVMFSISPWISNAVEDPSGGFIVPAGETPKLGGSVVSILFTPGCS